jgi:SulP family sulfate permease
VPLAPVGTAEYAALAALLALVVGVFRIIVGSLKSGWVVYLMSHSMMTGFLSAAAILILSSQLPGALGSLAPVDESVLQRAWFAVVHPDTWEWTAVGLSVFTIATVAGAASIHPLVPGVLMAAAGGLAFSVVTGYDGRTVGAIPSGLPPFSLDLPWSRLPSLIVPGIVISIIGFAEGVSISRMFASEDRQHWDADREFLSKGLANLAAGISAGLPVGGSLSRTSVNRLAGARSRWSGLITGVTVLCFLPIAPAMSALSRPQALIGWTTFVATLALSPHIERAVLIGIALSAAVHLWRELTPHVTAEREGDTLVVEPSGVLWFASAPAMEDLLFDRIADEPDVDKVVIRCTGLGRIDLTGAYVFYETLEHAERAGLDMRIEEVPDHALKLFRSVGVPMDDREPSEGASESREHAGVPPEDAVEPPDEGASEPHQSASRASRNGPEPTGAGAESSRARSEPSPAGSKSSGTGSESSS